MNSMQAILISQAVRATMLLAGAFLVTFAMRRASASARRLVWVVTATSLLALPVLSLVPLPAPSWGHAVAISVAPAASPAHTQTVIVARPTPPARVSWIVLIWAAGFLTVIARLVAGMIRLWWIKQSARRIEPAGTVTCLESDRVAMPMTFGVLRPTILLPAGCKVWPVERLRLVLAHELVHVQQHDCFFQLLMQVACALYWFHPLVWIAAARLLIERERACDDGVLRLGVAGPEYAGHLLELVRTIGKATQPALAVAMAQPSHLESRLVALLDAKVNRGKLSRRATAGIILAAACVLFPIAAVRGQAQGTRATIAGVVYDASGAVVPSATVLGTNLDANTKEASLASAAGEYSFSSIPAGHYTLDVSSPGFKIHRSYVTLKANDHQRLDIILELGNVSERVEVIGKKPVSQVAQAVSPHRIRVGGNVVAAQLVSKVAPVYPAYAQEKGIEGTVLLEAVISTEGGILSLKVVNTADADLARAATTAVQQWHYQPTLLNGQPVEVVTTITIDFRLTP